MSTGRRFAASLAIVVLSLCLSPPALAEFVGVIDAAGRIVVSLTGLVLRAELSGTLSVDGDLRLADGRLTFAVSGSFAGYGGWNPTSIVGEAWAAFRAAGAGDDPTVIRGLLYATSASELPLRAGETVAGLHYMVIEGAGAETVFEGTFSGLLVGGVVPSGKPLTLQFGGDASFSFVGEPLSQTSSSALPRSIPLDPKRMPEGFREHLRGLFGWELAVSTPSGEDDRP
jgi:hypothetical protein